MTLQQHWIETNTPNELTTELHAVWERTDALRAQMVARAAAYLPPAPKSLGELERLAPNLV